MAYTLKELILTNRRISTFSGILIIIAICLTGCAYSYYSRLPVIDQKVFPPDSATISYYLKLNLIPAFREPNNRNSMFHAAVEKALIDSGFKHFRKIEFENEISTQDDLKKNALLLDIRVKELYWKYTAPQDWLTGLSFGLIPSWSTRQELQIVCRLYREDRQIDNFDYILKSHWIAHIIFFPVFLARGPEFDYPYVAQPEQLTEVTKYFLTRFFGSKKVFEEVQEGS